MSNIKEFKPKATAPVVDEECLKSAQACVERIKTGQVVGLAIVMVERGTMNSFHSWGGDCPRGPLIGGMELLKNRIMGNVQETWALPFEADGPQADAMPGSKAVERDATFTDLPQGIDDEH